MNAPLIGITCGEIINRDHPASPTVYGQSFTYSDAIVHAGGTPCLLPLTTVAAARDLYDRLDGLLFAGGNDIDPACYGATPHPKLGEISPRRDAFELQLIRWALADGKPILAICRGMQLLNVAKGGTLYQDLASELPDSLDHQQSNLADRLDQVDQVLDIDSSSRLADILQSSSINANTYHHQAVKDLGGSLKATAWTSDDVVEALELPNSNFVIGVQCHPESIEHSTETRWQKLFNAFVAASLEFGNK